MSFGDCVYIAGPMRGYPCYNFKNFFYWQVFWEKSGYLVINPAEIDCKRALYSEWHFTEDQYDEILAEDIEILLANADFVFMLDGWDGSVGAKREKAAAEAAGIPVYKQTTEEE